MPSTPQQFYYKTNRLQQLRGFCYAAQFGNITRAAEHMGLTPSSVSLQIKALEDDLGITLFRRNGPQIALTEEGETLLNLALPHIYGIQHLHDVFHRELQENGTSHQDIVANSTGLNFILPAIAKEYLATNQGSYITIHYAEHDEAIKKIQEGTVDVALLPRRAHKPFPKGVDYIPVFYYTPSLITRSDHPLAGCKKLSVQEISKYDLTLPAEDLRVIPNLYDIFPKHNINKKLRINFVNWETTRKYIEAGLVISISSDVIIGKNDTLVATPLTHLFPMVDYGFVKKQGKILPEKVNKLIEVARQQAGKKDRD